MINPIGISGVLIMFSRELNVGGGRSSQSAGENPAYGKAVKNNWFGLEQGDPLSQINDPQIPICASNCPK